jgi:hypothetical protein
MDGADAPWNSVQSVSEPSPRKKGIRRGAKLLFIGGVLLPIAFVLALGADAPAFLVVPSIILFVGLVWVSYCRLFADDRPAARKQILATTYRASKYLPPTQVNPVNVLRPREPNTAEIVQPPSVTEYTTNLLNQRNQT